MWTALHRHDSQQLEDRFWTRVIRASESECWPWVGNKTHGYGTIRKDGRLVHAHRVAYQIAFGEPQPGMHVDHICRNRACVNPGHLRAVTHAENQQNRGVRSDSSSGVRNVFWHRRDRRWEVRVKHAGKSYFGGSFADKRDAETAATALRQTVFTHSPD